MTTRRMSRTRWGLALSAGLVAMLGLLACADGTRAGHQAADQVAAQLAAQLTPSATAASAGDVTPTPTFRPTEQAPTPQDIDREFEDTDDTEQDRRFLVQRYVEPMVRDTDVLMAMVAVPRHAFVPTRYLGQAYADHPLPIGYGQTISQPSLVAMMTEMLALEPGDRVLEIGTGSGYQAAILRELTDEVYTIEIIPELAGTARRVFDQLGYGDIHTLRGDGYYGWLGIRPVRRDHRDRRPGSHPRPADHAVESRGRAHGDPGRAAGRLPEPVPDHARRRRDRDAGDVRGGVRALHARGLGWGRVSHAAP